LIAPSRGSISWNDSSTKGTCALSAPDAPLYRELTCLENLRFFAQNRVDESALRAHLAKWDLEKARQRFRGELSSGLRARLGLAVASWFELCRFCCSTNRQRISMKAGAN
jgi:ABC-type multidrug transport system ATPase subunit